MHASQKSHAANLVALLATIALFAPACDRAATSHDDALEISAEAYSGSYAIMGERAPGVSPVEYRVEVRVKNAGRRPFLADEALTAFVPAQGSPFVIRTRSLKGLTEAEAMASKSLPIQVGPGETWTYNAATNGYTFMLHRDSGGRPLTFQVSFETANLTVAGPFRAELPELKTLPREGLIVGQGPRGAALSFDSPGVTRAAASSPSAGAPIRWGLWVGAVVGVCVVVALLLWIRKRPA